MQDPDKNSHVARIVHAPGWPHAAAVREHWPAQEPNGLTLTLALRGAEVTLRKHGRVCRRCDHDRYVWAPLGFTPRPCDFGACPRCDRWTAPPNSSSVRSMLIDEGFGVDALRLGEKVAWHELSDFSIMSIALFESRRARKWLLDGRAATRFFASDAKLDLGFAFTEAAYRNLLPTPDELCVTWDLAMVHGWAQTGDENRLTLVDVWAKFVPRARLLFACTGDGDALSLGA